MSFRGWGAEWLKALNLMVDRQTGGTMKLIGEAGLRVQVGAQV